MLIFGPKRAKKADQQEKFSNREKVRQKVQKVTLLRRGCATALPDFLSQRRNWGRACRVKEQSDWQKGAVLAPSETDRHRPCQACSGCATGLPVCKSHLLLSPLGVWGNQPSSFLFDMFSCEWLAFSLVELVNSTTSSSIV